MAHLAPAYNAPIETSDRGNTGAKMFVQDQTSPILNVPFLQSRTSLTLAIDTIVNSRTITVVDATGVTAGSVVELADTVAKKFMQAEVVVGGVAGNVITLDQPVNRIYTVAGSLVQNSGKSLLVDGSVTPQIFSVLPLPNQSGDMTKIMLEIRGEANQDLDFTKFGTDPELLNGCVLRINHGDGTFTNLFNFKSNSDFIEQGFPHAFLQPITGQAIGGFTSRLTYAGQNEYGVVARLDGALGEALEVVIQDNLTLNNTRIHLTAQGHELQD